MFLGIKNLYQYRVSDPRTGSKASQNYRHYSCMYLLTRFNLPFTQITRNRNRDRSM